MKNLKDTVENHNGEWGLLASILTEKVEVAIICISNDTSVTYEDIADCRGELNNLVDWINE